MIDAGAVLDFSINNDLVSDVLSGAKATGKAERTVRAAAARGEALGDDLLDIAGTSLDKGIELGALVSMPEPGGCVNFSVFGKSHIHFEMVDLSTSTASAISSCVAQPTLNPN